MDTDDIHALVTAASGAGKTAFFLYPNIEYALASGMSFLCTDTKGDLFRNYAGIYMYLRDHADSEGKCWPGIRTIAAELGLSRSTVKRALDELYKAELVAKEHRWRENGSLSSNLYRLL